MHQSGQIWSISCRKSSRWPWSHRLQTPRLGNALCLSEMLTNVCVCLGVCSKPTPRTTFSSVMVTCLALSTACTTCCWCCETQTDRINQKQLRNQTFAEFSTFFFFFLVFNKIWKHLQHWKVLFLLWNKKETEIKKKNHHPPNICDFFLPPASFFYIKELIGSYYREAFSQADITLNNQSRAVFSILLQQIKSWYFVMHCCLWRKISPCC